MPPAPAKPKSDAALPTVLQPVTLISAAHAMAHAAISNRHLFTRHLLRGLDIPYRAAQRRIGNGGEETQTGELLPVRLLFRHRVVLNRRAHRIRQPDVAGDALHVTAVELPHQEELLAIADDGRTNA